MNDVQLRHLWEFARGDADLITFEAWLYSDSELEAELGAPLYSELISCDFRKPEAVWKCRKALWPVLNSTKSCECHLVRNFDRIRVFPSDSDLDDFERWDYGDFVATHQIVFRPPEGGDTHHIARCNVCDTGWLMTEPPRNFDGNMIERVSDRLIAEAQKGSWPPSGTQTFQ